MEDAMKIHRYITGPLAVNSFLVVDEATNKGFLIDPGGADRKLLKFVSDNNVKVEYIVLTHGHGDHICGLKAYQNAWPDAKVIAHEEERQLLLDAKMNHSTVTCGYGLSITADRYVKDGEQISVGELTVNFLFTPGHTPGGMSVYVGDCVFSGDTLFAGSVGRTDFPGSSFSALKRSIEDKLYVLPANTRVYPGHMDYTTIGTEKEQNPFV
jgi:glyoxylase-like metal-dependent hydrolase (beta-lactamase superfamily II)